MLAPLSTQSHAALSSVTKDETLQDTAERLIELTARYDAANREADQIEGLYYQQRPQKPDVLRWRPQDGGFCSYSIEVVGGKRGAFCAPDDIEKLRNSPVMYQEFIGTQEDWDSFPVVGIPEDKKHLFEMRPVGGKSQERADEIVAVFDRYQADDKAVRVKLGLDEAQAKVSALHDHGSDLAEQIIDLQATGMVGLIAKARALHAWCFAGETIDPDDYDTTDTQMMAGMLRDILQMQSN